MQRLPPQKKKNFREVFANMDENGALNCFCLSFFSYTAINGYNVRRIKKMFSMMTPPAVDILEGMLLLDPETRLTAKQGLSHPFLAEYHDPECEPDSDPYDDSFESLELAVGEWKSKF